MFEVWLLRSPEGRLRRFSFEAAMTGWMTLHRRHVVAAARSENEADLTGLRERFLAREEGIAFHDEDWARRLVQEVGTFGGSAEVRSAADATSQTTSSLPPASAAAEPESSQDRAPSDLRVSQLARRYGVSSKEALSSLAAAGIPKETASSRVTADDVRRFRAVHGDPPARRRPQQDIGSGDGPSTSRSPASDVRPPEPPADGTIGTRPRRTDVFVCFAEEHTTVAHELSAALDQQGISTWLYFRDVPAGRNYQVEAARAIKAARAMVVLFSGETQDSRHCQSEVAIAYQARLPIYPVRLDDTDLDEMEYALVLAQWKRGLSEVIRAVVADIGPEATQTGS